MRIFFITAIQMFVHLKNYYFTNLYKDIILAECALSFMLLKKNVFIVVVYKPFHQFFQQFYNL